MKEIPVPETISVRLGKGPTGDEISEAISFKKFLVDCVDCYGEGAKTPKQIRQVNRLVDLIEKANGAVCLEDADFELLKGAVEMGKPPYLAVRILRQLVPYYDALAKAGIGKE